MDFLIKCIHAVRRLTVMGFHFEPGFGLGALSTGFWAEALNLSL